MLGSIRGRITAGSVLLAAVVLVALALVLGEQLRHVAGSSVAAMADDDLRSYVADLRYQPDEQPDPPRRGLQILVLSPAGTVTVDTLPPGLAPLVERAGSGTARLQHAGASYVAVGERLVNGRGTWRLWALRGTATADAALAAFGRVVLEAVPVILLLVAVGSWLLVGVALRPVRRLREAAERIRASGAPGQLPVGRSRDELDRLTETLNRFLAAQQASLERERRMVADASHELRTPLAVLTTELELARRHAGDAMALESALAGAQADVGALSRLATQLLELSALDSERLRREVAPVGALLSELMGAVDRARALAPAGVEVEFELTGAIDEDVLAPLSAMAFGRIVDNLAMNAVHATASGTVELRLTQEPRRLTLTVTDTGRGFPPEFLPHAFDRFTRSERSRADGAPGSGIGLALVRALVDAAGGEVTVANRAEGGAVASVTIALPA